MDDWTQYPRLIEQLPHRNGCWWQESDLRVEKDLLQRSWLEVLDWSAYHAPGSHIWQEYRKRMLTVPVTERYHWMWQWLHASRHWNEAIAVPAEDIVRVMNLCRSLRGQWRQLPEVKQLAADLHRTWLWRKHNATCPEGHFCKTHLEV
jgi:hypothetical protein